MAGFASGSTGAAGVATVLGFMPLGVSAGVLMLGGGAFLLGVAARAGGILFKKLDGTQPIAVSDIVRPFAACLAMIPVAAAASCIVFLAASLTNVGINTATEGGCGGALLLLGLRGLEGFQWLANAGSGIFMKFTPQGGQKNGGSAP